MPDEIVKRTSFMVICECGLHFNVPGEGVVEINFRDLKMYFRCPDKNCNKMNIIDFSTLRPKPFPNMRISR